MVHIFIKININKIETVNRMSNPPLDVRTIAAPLLLGGRHFVHKSAAIANTSRNNNGFGRVIKRKRH